MKNALISFDFHSPFWIKEGQHRQTPLSHTPPQGIPTNGKTGTSPWAQMKDPPVGHPQGASTNVPLVPLELSWWSLLGGSSRGISGPQDCPKGYRRVGPRDTREAEQ